MSAIKELLEQKFYNEIDDIVSELNDMHPSMHKSYIETHAPEIAEETCFEESEVREAICRKL